MVVYCSVCLNNNKKNRNISYFNYPKDYDRRNIWLKAVGREDLLLKLANPKTRQQYRICEEHFERNCIKFSKKRTIKYLFDYAFPTLKLWSKEGATSSSTQDFFFPVVNFPSNTGANLNQFEVVDTLCTDVQENQEIHILPTCEVPTNNFLNKTIIIEDHKSHTIKTESNMQICMYSWTNTMLDPSAVTPIKSKLLLEHPEKKTKSDLDNISKKDFLKLCDKFMTKSMSQFIKRQIDEKANNENWHSPPFSIFKHNLYFSSPAGYFF